MHRQETLISFDFMFLGTPSNKIN